MEAGKVTLNGKVKSLDLIDAMVAAADDNVSDADVEAHRALGLPDLRLVLGHVHRQLDELPDRSARPRIARQRLGARHPCRPQGSVRRGRTSHRRSRAALLRTGRRTACCRAAIASFKAFENAMTLDIAMGGSTNTVLHLLAAAHEGDVPFTMKDIDRLSRRVPVLVQGRAFRAGRASGRRASRRRHHGHSRRTRSRRPDRRRPADGAQHLAGGRAGALGHQAHDKRERAHLLLRRARRRAAPQVAFSQDKRFEELDADRATGCIRDAEHAFSKDGGLAVLYGNIARDGCIVKTAGVDDSILVFSGPARVFESQDAAVDAILGDKIKPGRCGGDSLRGAARRPRNAGDAVSDQLSEIEGARQSSAR